MLKEQRQWWGKVWTIKVDQRVVQLPNFSRVVGSIPDLQVYILPSNYLPVVNKLLIWMMPPGGEMENKSLQMYKMFC